MSEEREENESRNIFGCKTEKENFIAYSVQRVYKLIKKNN